MRYRRRYHQIPADQGERGGVAGFHATHVNKPAPPDPLRLRRLSTRASVQTAREGVQEGRARAPKSGRGYHLRQHRDASNHSLAFAKTAAISQCSQVSGEVLYFKGLVMVGRE